MRIPSETYQENNPTAAQAVSSCQLSESERRVIQERLRRQYLQSDLRDGESDLAPASTQKQVNRSRAIGFWSLFVRPMQTGRNRA